MSKITKILLILGVVFYSSGAFCDSGIDAYKGRYADALFIKSDDKRTLLVSGGAVPQGGSTAADCFAKAIIGLKKQPNYFEGPLDPVKNDIVSIDESISSGRRVGVYLHSDHLRIGNVEVDGICADGIDFSGNYRKISKNTVAYRNIYLYFMLAAGQDALHLKESGHVNLVKEELKPFIDNMKNSWKFDPNDQMSIDKIKNLYFGNQ